MPRRVDPNLRPALAAVLVALLAACRAERVLIVTSDPPGAEVLLDGTGLGVTPLTHDFVHYGTRRLTLYLDGYLTSSEVIEMKPPWFGRFPLDLVTEVLIPFGWRDEHTYDADLVPGRARIEDPDLRSVLQRAEVLRTAGPEGPRATSDEERRARERRAAAARQSAEERAATSTSEPVPAAPPPEQPDEADGSDPEPAVPPGTPGPSLAPEEPGAREARALDARA